MAGILLEVLIKGHWSISVIKENRTFVGDNNDNW